MCTESTVGDSKTSLGQRSAIGNRFIGQGRQHHRAAAHRRIQVVEALGAGAVGAGDFIHAIPHALKVTGLVPKQIQLDGVGRAACGLLKHPFFESTTPSPTTKPFPQGVSRFEATRGLNKVEPQS